MGRHLYFDTTFVASVCRQFGISRPKLYRYVGTKWAATTEIETEA
jgi:hypothetical protein